MIVFVSGFISGFVFAVIVKITTIGFIIGERKNE